MTQAPAVEARTSPFQGLRNYDEEDAEFFFGRGQERDVIIANLKANRLTVLYGPSGVGKSSLLRAGVEATLREHAIASYERLGTPEFVTVVFSAWQDDPSKALAIAITEAVEQVTGGRFTPAESLDETILSAAKVADASLLVILDQFEDFSLYHGSRNGASNFATEFPRLVNDTRLPVSFLVSVREDALAELDRFKRSIPGLLDTRLRVNPLKGAAARAAITGPIDKYNELVGPGGQVKIEDQLVDAVLSQVEVGKVRRKGAGRGGGASATSDAKRDSGTEGAGGERSGGVEAAYLQLVMTRLWEREMAGGNAPCNGVRALRLATLDELGGAQKIVREHLDEALVDLSSDERDAAVDVFQYLVTPSGTKITHGLGTLAAWSRHSNEEVKSLLAKLEGSARIIRPIPPEPGTDEPRYEVFHDVLASAILEWSLGETEKRQLARLAQDRERLERERLEAEERAHQERRRARTFGALAIGSGLLLVIAAIAVVFAEIQTRRANQDQRTAQSALLAAHAKSAFATNPDLGALLSLEAYRLAPTADAHSAILTALSGDQPTLTGHTDKVDSVAFSPDGKSLASGSDDNTIRLWNVATHQAIGRPLTDTNTVQTVAFSPDGRTLASGDWDNTIRLWNVATHHEIGRPLTGHNNTVESVAFSPDGKTLASGGDDNTVRLWNVATHRETGRPLTGHTDNVNSVAFSPDGKILASGSDDNTVRLWNVATHREIGRPLTGHTNNVKSVAFNADGKTLASGSWDNTIRLWNVATHREIGRPLIGHSDSVNSVAFSPDGRTLASGSSDKTIRLWSVATHETLGLRLTGTASHQVIWSAHGLLASANDDHTISLPDIRSGFNAAHPLVSHGTSTALAASPRGNLVATTTGSGKVLALWDIRTGLQVGRTMTGDTDVIDAVAFSPDGKLLASGSNDNTLRLWSVATQREIGRPLTGQTGHVESVAFSPDGTLLASGNDDHTVRLWSIATQREIGRPLTGHTDTVSFVAFSPDGTTLASGSTDDTIRLWNVRTRSPIGGALAGHLGSVYAVAFSPDGKTLASGSADQTIRFWSVATHHQTGTPLAEQGEVQDIAYSANGKTLADVTSVYDPSNSSSNFRLQLWDMATGVPLGPQWDYPVPAFEPSLAVVGFASSGELVTSDGGGGGVGTLVWSPLLTSSSYAAFRNALCPIVGRNLTTAEWSVALPGQPYHKTCTA